MFAFELAKVRFAVFSEDVGYAHFLQVLNLGVQIGKRPVQLTGKGASHSGLSGAHEPHQINSLDIHKRYRLTHANKGSTSGVESFVRWEGPCHFRIRSQLSPVAAAVLDARSFNRWPPTAQKSRSPMFRTKLSL